MNNDTPLFRRLGPADAELLAGLEKICFTMPWRAEQYRSSLAHASFAAFGFFLGQRLAGYISFYHAAGELEIVNLAVHPDNRRQGIGGRMLRLALQAGRKMGMQKATLEVRRSNVPAIALYEGAGFHPCGLRQFYYSDTGEDALVYVCELAPAAERNQNRKDLQCKR